MSATSRSRARRASPSGLLSLGPPGDSRARERRGGGSTGVTSLSPRLKKSSSLREKGVALVLTLIAITMLEIALTDMQQSTSTAHALSVAQRQDYIVKIRMLASAVARAYVAQREALGHPLKKGGA